ncbi:oxygen-dependent tRNA uridine(34) hydroxylase TrhO [Candidatus Erwinia haradaeae]|uniref:tRNA uridine(34) hydroxylase n=1 Tax=Candidatus Erwinia haradaeae TaxID=1922217 RepID=A0A451D7P1_9GAMM|nr:rhodanese-related sulfurtransferase [Candidatus Erwinia haradaeae]VFP81775.1 UPF0176 protein YceA [Candidatus Erwinia haradaeae]
MTVLFNKINNKELKDQLLKEDVERTTLSFYKYFTIDDPWSFRHSLYLGLSRLNIFGRIYIANEGINAQVSVPSHLYESMLDVLGDIHCQLSNMRINISLDNNRQSFWVLRLKVRHRIVADGITDSSFDASDVGIYLTADEVNGFHDNPEVIFIDMRNDYEYEVGHFDNTFMTPGSTFRQKLPIVVEMLKKDKERTIVLYCTGGIRCEKASAWMRYNGFKNIYHIDGGIIQYVRVSRMLGLPIYFKGKNFVFDQRMYESVSNDIISYCHCCGKLCDSHINCRNNICHRLFIQCQDCSVRLNSCCSLSCMKNNLLLSKERALLTDLTR